MDGFWIEVLAIFVVLILYDITLGKWFRANEAKKRLINNLEAVVEVVEGKVEDERDDIEYIFDGTIDGALNIQRNCVYSPHALLHITQRANDIVEIDVLSGKGYGYGWLKAVKGDKIINTKENYILVEKAA